MHDTLRRAEKFYLHCVPEPSHPFASSASDSLSLPPSDISLLSSRYVFSLSCFRLLVSAYSIGVAPGRVNLIGEHTDYNGGFVLPLAIDRFAAVVVTRSSSSSQQQQDQWRIVSENNTADDQKNAVATGDTQMEDASSSSSAAAAITSSSNSSSAPLSFTSAQLVQPYSATGAGWHNYVRGVITSFLNSGYTLPALDIAIAGNVPLGGGLSSSSALTIATAAAIQSFISSNPSTLTPSSIPFDPVSIAKIAQKAEHDFAGVPCGIMDQFVIALAQKDKAMLLDCRSLVSRKHVGQKSKKQGMHSIIIIEKASILKTLNNFSHFFLPFHFIFSQLSFFQQPTLIEFDDPNVSLLITSQYSQHLEPDLMRKSKVNFPSNPFFDR